MMFRGVHEEGQGLVEYALIILFIALVVILVVGLLGTQLSMAFELVTNSFPP
jgi:Flp pilus assembly pilin Flp